MKFFYIILLSFSYIVNAQIMPTIGLVGYWPFDGNANDMSGNGNNGIVNGAIPAPDRFGNINKAYKFNGVNSKITVLHNSSIDIPNNTDFTFTYWQKSYTNNIDRIILSKHTPGTWNGYNFIAGNSQNPGYCTTPQHIYFYAAAGAQQDACSNGALLADSTWHFIVGMYKASTNQTFLYIDGVLQSDIGQSSGSMSNNSNMSFGYDDDNNNGFFNGVLDGGRLYKRTLTEAEITILYSEDNNTTSINKKEISSGDLVSLYPNPNNGEFTININNYSKNNNNIIKIINQLGQVVYQTDMKNNEIPLKTKLTNGVYFLNITGNLGNRINKKIVIKN